MNLSGAVKYQSNKITSIRLSVSALRGGGKTHFLGTLTQPSLLIDFDGGLQGVIDKFTDKNNEFYVGDEIYVADLTAEYDTLLTDKSETKKSAVALKERINALIEDAISQGVRSIGIDGGWGFWENTKLSFFGDSDDPLPAAYSKPNSDFEHFVRRFNSCDTNLVITHHLKEKWSGAKTKSAGEYDIAGYSRVENLVHASLAIKENIVTDADGNKQLYWTGEFWKSRFNPTLQLYPPIDSRTGMLDFPNIAAMVTDTDVEMWK